MSDDQNQDRRFFMPRDRRKIMETVENNHLIQAETQPDAAFTKVIDGREIVVRVFFNAGAETMQQKIERMLRMDILRASKELLP